MEKIEEKLKLVIDNINSQLSTKELRCKSFDVEGVDLSADLNKERYSSLVEYLGILITARSYLHSARRLHERYNLEIEHENIRERVQLGIAYVSNNIKKKFVEFRTKPSKGYY